MQRVLLFDRSHRFRTELVATFISIMASVAFDPMPFHLMHGSGHIQRAPKILVLHQLFAGSLPSVFLPPGQPLGDAVPDILGIGVHLHHTRLFQEAERLDGRSQFHAIVRRGRLATADFLVMPARLHDGRPAPYARIAYAAAVSVDDDF